MKLLAAIMIFVVPYTCGRISSNYPQYPELFNQQPRVHYPHWLHEKDTALEMEKTPEDQQPAWYTNWKNYRNYMNKPYSLNLVQDTARLDYPLTPNPSGYQKYYQGLKHRPSSYKKYYKQQSHKPNGYDNKFDDFMYGNDRYTGPGKILGPSGYIPFPLQ